MPNFESSELGRLGVDALVGSRIDMLARRMAAGPDGQPPDDARLRKVAQDFASVFYGMAFKEMQQTTHLPGGGDEEGDDGDDQSAVAQGAQDFVGMFLPQAVAGDGADPLASYIYESLKQRFGGALDEKA
jgi:hypothetical protein